MHLVRIVCKKCQVLLHDSKRCQRYIQRSAEAIVQHPCLSERSESKILSVRCFVRGFLVVMTIVFVGVFSVFLWPKWVMDKRTERTEARTDATPRESLPFSGRPNFLETREATARIIGSLTNDSDEELSGVVVRAVATEFPFARTALSDAQGQYSLEGLPPGGYSVVASRLGYVTQQYGENGFSGSGVRVDIGKGQSVKRVDLRLARAGAVTGRIVDESGEPVVDASASLMREELVRGHRRLTVVGVGGASNRTDDLGQFRLFGVRPGSYYVSVNASSRNVVAGDTAGYPRTYFPNASDPGKAQLVDVEAGRDTIANVSIRPVSVFHVAGRVTTSNGGVPVSGSIRFFQPENESDGPGLAEHVTIVPLQQGGTFAVDGIAAGRYILVATVAVNASSPASSRILEIGIVRSVVNGNNKDIVVKTDETTAISGELVFENDSRPQSTRRLRVSAASVDGDSSWLDVTSATIDGDDKFELRNLPRGRNVVAVTGLDEDMVVRVVQHDGNDITDQGIQTKDAKVGNVKVFITNHLAELSGVVKSANGRPIADCQVMALERAKDKQRHPFERYMKISMTGKDGQFLIGPLPPGHYFVIANKRDSLRSELGGSFAGIKTDTPLVLLTAGVKAHIDLRSCS